MTPGLAVALLAPYFTAGSVIPFGSLRPRMLKPGGIATIYGRELASGDPCPSRIFRRTPLPTDACGVRVLIGNDKARLLYLSPAQINFVVPETAPQAGTAPIQVCVRDLCSEPVAVRFSAKKAYLRIAGTAYAGMPVWLEIDEPVPYEARYPFQPMPWSVDPYLIQVVTQGKPLPPRSHSHVGGVVGGILGGSVAPDDAPKGRLPLHLLFDLTRPGRYSVMLASTHGAISDWTDFTVLPSTPAQRAKWFREVAAQLRAGTPGQIVGDILPSLLAQADEPTRRVIQPLLEHESPLVRAYARYSLAFFTR
jgi:hypothetical protein